MRRARQHAGDNERGLAVNPKSSVVSLEKYYLIARLCSFPKPNLETSCAPRNELLQLLDTCGQVFATI
jgi:hypothetical protein